MTRLAGDGAVTEYVEPAVTLRVGAGGTALTVGDGDESPPRPVGEVADALKAIGDLAGPIELCVEADLANADVIEIIRQVNRAVVDPILLECRKEKQ